VKLNKGRINIPFTIKIFKIFFIWGSIFVVSTAFSTPRSDCLKRIESYQYQSQERAFYLVCSKATVYTVDVIDYVVDNMNTTNYEKLAFLAGEATAFTVECVESFWRHAGFKRIDSLSMLCRSISKEEYSDLTTFYNRHLNYTAMELSKITSPTSLESFLKLYKKTYERDYCEDVECH
jgi:hypothetical protein